MISDAFVKVECDHCGEIDEVPLTALAHPGSYDMRDVDAWLRRHNWRCDGEDAHTCEACVELEKEAEG